MVFRVPPIRYPQCNECSVNHRRCACFILLCVKNSQFSIKTKVNFKTKIFFQTKLCIVTLSFVSNINSFLFSRHCFKLLRMDGERWAGCATKERVYNCRLFANSYLREWCKDIGLDNVGDVNNFLQVSRNYHLTFDGGHLNSCKGQLPQRIGRNWCFFLTLSITYVQLSSLALALSLTARLLCSWRTCTLGKNPLTARFATKRSLFPSIKPLSLTMVKAEATAMASTILVILGKHSS